MTFMRFLNLTISDDILDSKTVLHFKEKIIDLEVIEPAFHLFIKELERLKLVVNEGKIVDASFVEMQKQRNSKEKNEEIKKGKIPREFTDNLNKGAQKDTDAR